MAVPKRRVSHARRDKRRSNVWKMDAPTLVKCPSCGELMQAHVVCKACGKYNGRQVLKVEEEA
jgi:large subunit ribosomal protein L32